MNISGGAPDSMADNGFADTPKGRELAGALNIADPAPDNGQQV